jgi:ATP-dependent Clp protease ATP-binding subunit ClpC
MTDEIQTLIDSLRRGQYEDPSEKISLLSAALQEHKAGVALLLSLIRAPQIPLRLAAMDAAQGRTEPELLAELVGLAPNPDFRIRVKLAEILRLHTDKSTISALQTLIEDSESVVRIAALKSTAGRPEFRTAQENCLAYDSEWTVRLTAVSALEGQKSHEVVRALFNAVKDDDTEIGRRCAELIEKRFNQFPAATQKNLKADIAQLTKVEKQLKEFGADRFPKFMIWITAQTTVQVDPADLVRFGTDLTALALDGTLPRAHYVEEDCETVLKLLEREPRRSIALLGAAGVGKTALVNELVYRLATAQHGRWRVLRVSPTDFMSGTKYLGEWETKLRELIEAIRKPRRVLLYIPNLSDLSMVGTWSKSESSVATALVPYLEDGSVVALGEAAPEEYERGLGRIPSLRRVFGKVLLLEPSVDRTRNVLRAIRDAHHSALSDDMLDQLLEVSSQFLSHISRPGNAVELLQAATKKEKETNRPLIFRDVLDVLSRSTGIPVDLLDDATPLKNAEVRDFFEKRIIGQSRAIGAVADLVTLIKAGVTDPNKPFGVFLFVGPTGVGKTELARTLAEFIFGDPARLKRFDMSEFATYEGFTRLIGNNNENGILTDAVRQQPFSVVLLDEIEKGHANVFDLCLQIFDAGRLTDGRGRTVDFRRTIVILTSNIGATTSSIGFGSGDTEQSTDSDKDHTPRELSRFFRPEFLNRLDRIIQFQPLSLQYAEQIARREIQVVLQRSGIRRRQLSVDVDDAVVSLLVRVGYSPRFGARPLKRTVERLLLLPLARAISSGSLRGRTVLRLTEDNGRVQAVMTSPATAKPIDGSAAADRSREPLSARFAEMRERYDALEGAMRTLADRKSELIIHTQEPNFFKDPDVRAATFTEIHNLDAFLSLHQEIGKAIRNLPKQLDRDVLDRISRDVAYLGFVARCKNARDLGDAILALSLVDRTGQTQKAIEKLAGMYQGLANGRRMTADILGEYYNDKQDRVYLLVGGFGAYGLLKHESGLHQVDRRYKDRTPRSRREVICEDRELVRVETHPVTAKPSKLFQRHVKAKVSTLKPARKRLLNADFSVSLFHEPSVRSIEFWTNGPKEEALDRGLTVLHAVAEPAQSRETESVGIVRQYDVGMAARVKDFRTGRTTTRVNHVFKGDLGPLLVLNSE